MKFVTNGIALALLTSIIGTYGSAQDSNPFGLPARQGQQADVFVQELATSPGQARYSLTFDTQDELTNAMGVLKNSESDEEKSEAKKTIKKELEKRYDVFLEQNQARLDEMYDRLKKLEQQMEKRREAKDRMVELKMEMLISQAEGLGWPDDQRSFFNTTSPFDQRLNVTPIRSFPASPAQPQPAVRFETTPTGRGGR